MEINLIAFDMSSIHRRLHVAITKMWINFVCPQTYLLQVSIKIGKSVQYFLLNDIYNYA
jgi:hypothetical protein